MAFAFDTLVQAKRLREAGFDEKQAEALTTVLRDAVKPFDTLELATKADLAALAVATKADIAALKADLAALSVATKADLAALKADLKADLSALKAEVATKSELAAEVAALKADLLQWIVGLIAGAVVLNALVVVGSIFGLLKLLGH
jgi:ribosomal protein L29